MPSEFNSNPSGHQHLLQELQEKNELLQNIFDNGLIGMCILETVHSEAGQVEDFRIKVVNKEMEKLTGHTNLVNQLCSVKYPCIKKTGLFDLMLEVMYTGKARQAEYNYRQDGSNSWFSSMFVKMGNGLASINLDISGRKLIEEERFKIFSLLEQTEALAATGSWEFNSFNGQLTWSKGMYCVFELPFETEVKPEIYLQYAVKSSRSVARRIVNCIKSGKHFEETLEITVNNTSKTLKIKASAIPHIQDSSLKVIGVAVDITRQLKFLQEKHQLETMQIEIENGQSQKIFVAGLNAQEEERKRIAESLHNGIGQLLYAVKMSLSMVDLNKNPDHASLYQAKQATEQLLTEAIKESRRISHELTPIILEEFGLEAAISDICRQFETSISIKCSFSGLTARLDKFLEISVYRMVQELLVNIIKHAGATHATVHVEQQKKQIILAVWNDGTGFDQIRGKGIGLQTIFNTVKLLNGTFDIKVTSGTQITISLPCSVMGMPLD